MFAAALESTRVGVLIRDMRAPNRPVVFINKAFTDLTGYDYESVGDKTSEFLFGYNTDQDAIAAYRCFDDSGKQNAASDAISQERRIVLERMASVPCFGPDGTLTHFVSLFTDTSAMRKVQDELIEAKQMVEHGSAVKRTSLR